MSSTYLGALNADADDAHSQKHEQAQKFSVGDTSKYVDPTTKKMMDDFIKRMNMSLGEAALLGFERGKKEASTWIKTADRSPDKGVFVLIAPGSYDPVSMGKISEYDGVWYDVVDTDQDGGYYGMISQPTYWMPLPEPPKQ